jgi:hypothetical protein
MKTPTAAETQAALAAQSKDSFNLLLLQKKIADDVAKGDGAALEKDIAELSTTYRHFVYQDRTLRHSNLDSKLVDKIEQDQYTLGQDYKKLETDARNAIKAGVKSLNAADTKNLTNDLLMTNADASSLANGSSGEKMAWAANAKIIGDLNLIYDYEAYINEDLKSGDKVSLKKDQDKLKAVYADLNSQIAVFKSLGVDPKLAEQMKSSSDSMKPAIDKLLAGQHLTDDASKTIKVASGDITTALNKMMVDIPSKRAQLAASSKGLADIASLLKSISDDLKSGDKQALAKDRAAIASAYSSLVAQTKLVAKYIADPALVDALKTQTGLIKQGTDALNTAADGGTEKDPTAAAALIAALKSAMELVTKMG